MTDAQRNQGATSGNPIQNIKDYGFELGGPLKRGRAWIWRSFGKPLVDVGKATRTNASSRDRRGRMAAVSPTC